ncbi:MAG: helix-turn-helix transcriptional regulator [Ruminococcaceae bacterium]|nr:helix-turn-helix transcriptional regulator [Oscillospiraceae bacterium]
MYSYGYRDRFLFFVRDRYETEQIYRENPFPYRETFRMISAHAIYYCLEGQMEIQSEGSRYLLNPGEICIMRESEGHVVRVTRFPTEFYDMSFSLHYFRIVDPEYRLYRPFVERQLGVGNVLKASAVNHELLKAAFDHVATTHDTYTRRIAVMGAMELVLLELLRAHRPENFKEPEERDPLTVKILDYINSHLAGEDLEPEALAARFYVSRSQLNRLIKNGTGFTLWNYITCKRLSHAFYQMQAGMSNKEAATDSGFQDYSTFYKAYVRFKGFPPKDDRPTETYDPMLTNFYQVDDSAILIGSK